VLSLLAGTTRNIVVLHDDVRQIMSVVPTDDVAQIRYDLRRQPTPPIPATRWCCLPGA
jgi:hypothetical protein